MTEQHIQMYPSLPLSMALEQVLRLDLLKLLPFFPAALAASDSAIGAGDAAGSTAYGLAKSVFGSYFGTSTESVSIAGPAYAPATDGSQNG